MVAVLEEMLETSLNVSPESHYMGALGAALFALERLESGISAAVVGAAGEAS